LHRPESLEKSVHDLIFIVITCAFFGVAAAYTYGCEKLRGGNHD
jgi:hypothetical protein